MTEQNQKIKSFTVDWTDGKFTELNRVTGLSEISNESGFPRMTVADNGKYYNLNLNHVKFYTITMEDIV